ncbi:MAG: putative DNA binding domain-containing protein [Chloroflexi bacterium]|nr:putative DNA binding domain-containing protein [Chloroflexota bacterium]MCL5074271.1 putative DNA binding domain-containing protein [Chloroflexota bacterium]
MSINVEQLIEQGEGHYIEFKESLSAENEAIETLCAFANAEGGTVLVGVSDAGLVVGASLGTNTLENFANKLHRSTEPPLYVSLTSHQVDAKTVVAISVKAPRQGELFYAFGKPLIRVGKTNQVMSPQEQRERLLAGQKDWSEERNCPRFELFSRSLTRTEDKFQPNWNLQQVAGDYVPTIEWRFRGVRFRPPMEWRQVSGAQLKNFTCSATFDLSQPPGRDDLVPEGQIGFEIRFHWRGRLRHEIHRFSLSRADRPTKALWDVGEEILPPLYQDE